jgi:alanine-glyoxylate transaminase/serine-glyoxylate transaminase/serine-pyruvate transaminase
MNMQKIRGVAKYPPDRLLLGPGPSNVHPRVYQALTSHVVGHLDPYFFEVMDETKDLLKQTFRTQNEVTFPISGTGMAGMEAAICNLVEPGDELVVCVNGFFGARMSEIAQRNGAKVVEIKENWGKPVSVEAVKTAMSECARPVAVALVHAETSTGVLQSLSEIATVAHEDGAVLIADTVTSLGGVELDVDRMGIDVAYSGSQKCLNCPPGLSPITASERAIEKIRNRKTKVRSWYFDLTEIEKYWSNMRAYHHTGPISMIYALREALSIVQEDGLENRWIRHQRNCEALVGGLEAMELTTLVEKSGDRLPSLTAVRVPDGVADTKLRMRLLTEYNIEVGGGLGELKGLILRIGLMGLNSSRRNVILLLDALESALRMEGYSVKKGVGLEAALALYEP